MMPTPFPGMDPYLEARNIWRDVHLSLIAAIRDALAPQVAPGYFVAVEERTYIVEVDRQEFVTHPDAAIIAASSEPQPERAQRASTALATAAQTVTVPLVERVHERYLEIRDAQTHEVVTAIEPLSPTNKIPGHGRQEYEAKRRHVLLMWTNLVEIDLLRSGQPMAMEPVPASDYHILVAPGWERPCARLFAFSVREVIPVVPVPLREGEEEAVMALGTLLADVYDRARYDIRLDYGRTPPGPPLSPEDVAWVDELLRAKGLRGG